MVAEKWTSRAAGLSAMFASAFVLAVCTVTLAHADGGDLPHAERTATMRADGISIKLDQAYPVHLAAPAEGVAIGNPNIAAVSVQNDRLLFVTGRSYGSTNLVVTGAGNRILYSGRITVEADETSVVMVTRGVEAERLECNPVCRPRPDIGEPATSFADTNSQITGRVSAGGGSH